MAKSYLDKEGLLYFLQKIRATATPLMNGTAATGGSTHRFAFEDHVHPSDTTKVDKVTGKGLSTNDYTTTEKDKLSGIAAGAEVNVQADWNETNTSSDAYIKNKPTIPEGSVVDSSLSTTSTNPVQNKVITGALNDKVDAVSGKGLSTNDYTTAEKTKVGKLVFDSNNLIDSSILPSYIDDVIEAYPRSSATELSSSWLSLTASGSALTPEGGKIYVLMADSTSYAANSQFRWGGSAYVKLSDGGVSSITNAEIDTIVAS